MPAQASPPLGAARPSPPPLANGCAPSPSGAVRPRRPILRTRTSGIRTALIAGVLALLLAAIAGALLIATAGTARITQPRQAIHRTRRGQPPAPATRGKKEQRPC